MIIALITAVMVMVSSYEVINVNIVSKYLFLYKLVSFFFYKFHHSTEMFSLKNLKIVIEYPDDVLSSVPSIEWKF